MPTATGAIAIAKERLRTTLANCTALRAWMGAGTTVAQALERIYLDSLPPHDASADKFTAAQLQALRPYVLISKVEQAGVTWHANAGPRRSAPGGTLLAVFFENIPTDTSDPGEIVRRFEDVIAGTVCSLDESWVTLTSLRGTAGFTDWNRISESGPFRCDPDEVTDHGDFQFHILQIDWGMS